MKIRTFAILLLAVFLTSILAGPAFAYDKYRPGVQGANRWIAVSEPAECTLCPKKVECVRCERICPEEKCITNPIQGTLHAAGEILKSECKVDCVDCPTACATNACEKDEGLVYHLLMPARYAYAAVSGLFGSACP